MSPLPGSDYRLGGYHERRAPAALARWVDSVWWYARPPAAPPIPGRGHRVLPDAGVSLCFGCLRGADGVVLAGRLLLMGPIASTRFFAPGPGVHLEAVKLKPEWVWPLLRAAPDEVVDRSPRLREVVGPAAGDRGAISGLESALAGTRGSADAIRHLLGFIEAGIVRSRPSRAAEVAHRGLEGMRRVGPSMATVGAVARELGVSERQFRRAVRELTGAGPKHHQRLGRLGMAVAAADRCRGTPNWARLAVEMGYFDQAHLIRDYRDLTGQTPMESHRERCRQQPG